MVLDTAALEEPCAVDQFCSSEQAGAFGTCAACANGECGCKDPLATNFLPDAVHFSASCTYDCDAAGWTCVGACVGTVCPASNYEAQGTRLELGDGEHRIFRYASYSHFTDGVAPFHNCSKPRACTHIQNYQALRSCC